jgi:hypothetical protein
MIIPDVRKVVSGRSSERDRKDEFGHVHCPRGATLDGFWFVSIVVFFCSCFTVSNQYIGDPIHCAFQSNYRAVNLKVFEQFCWVQGTFSMVAYDEAEINGFGPR